MIEAPVTGKTFTPPTGTTVAQQTAAAQIKQYLLQLGFPTSTADQLSSWAWGEIVKGKSFDEISLDITQQPAFKNEFPEIDLRKQAGLPPMSPAEILAYRQKGAELARAAGLPPSFYDQKSDFTNLIVNNVSFEDFANRVKAAQIAAYEVPADVREAFKGVLGIGDFTALAFDPKIASPLLDRKIKEAEAVTAAARTGYGSLTEAQRAQIVDSGVSFQQEQDVLGQLANAQELFLDISGNGTEGGAISRDEQISSQFAGNANAQKRIQDRAAQRKATFQGSAGFGASQQGVSGLGSAS